MASMRRAVRMLAMVATCSFVVAAGWGVGGMGHDMPAIALADVAPVGDLTARWDGTWDSDKFAVEGTLTTLLVQSASVLGGHVTLTGTACLSVGEVSGTVDGDTVVFGAIFAGDVQADFLGTVLDGGTTMRGTYEVTGGACSGDTGEWRVARTARACDVNGDGVINPQDAMTLFRFLRHGGEPLPGYSDCNRDGLVNIHDVLAIIKTVR